MCSPQIYNSEIKIEFNNNLDKLNLLILEVEKLLKKKSIDKNVKENNMNEIKE